MIDRALIAGKRSKRQRDKEKRAADIYRNDRQMAGHLCIKALGDTCKKKREPREDFVRETPRHDRSGQRDSANGSDAPIVPRDRGTHQCLRPAHPPVR